MKSTATPSSARRQLALIAATVLMALLVTCAAPSVAAARAQEPEEDVHVGAEERLALAEEAVELEELDGAAGAAGSSSMYPPCPPSPARGNLTDLEYVLRGFEAAPVFDGPFKYITYWQGGTRRGGGTLSPSLDAFTQLSTDTPQTT